MLSGLFKLTYPAIFGGRYGERRRERGMLCCVCMWKRLLRPNLSILLDVDVLVRLEGPHGVIGELDTSGNPGV